MKGTLSRRARSKSGGEFPLPRPDDDGEDELPFNPGLDAYAIGPRKGVNTKDSATEFFGDINSGADVGSRGGGDMDSDDNDDIDMVDDDDDGAATSSSNSGTQSSITFTTRNKGSPLARLKRSVGSTRRKVKSAGGGATMAVGRTWLGPSSPPDPLDAANKSSHTVGGSTEYMESRR